MIRIMMVFVMILKLQDAKMKQHAIMLLTQQMKTDHAFLQKQDTIVKVFA